MNINNLDYVTHMRLGRIIELAINSPIYPDCLLKENGLNRQNIEIIKNHFPACSTCQKLYDEHKEMSSGLKQEILPFNTDLQKIYDECGPAIAELYEIIEFKKAEAELDKEEWKNLSEKEKKIFKETIFSKFKFYDKEILSLVNTDAEYFCSINNVKIQKAFSEKFEAEKNKIIKTIKKLLFGQFINKLSNITYLKGSDLIYELSNTFQKLFDKAVQEYELDCLKEIENVKINKKKKTKKKIQKHSDPIKILLDHIAK